MRFRALCAFIGLELEDMRADEGVVIGNTDEVQVPGGVESEKEGEPDEARAVPARQQKGKNRVIEAGLSESEECAVSNASVCYGLTLAPRYRSEENEEGDNHSDPVARSAITPKRRKDAK